jgi:L-seryl-tRNA(Ser) seleniumtransferase
MRAFRVDKMTYAALEATLLEYATGRARETVPVAAMLSASLESLETRAHALVARLGGHPGLRAEIVDGFSTVGGGAAPASAIPTRLVALEARGLTADSLEQRLRGLDTPIVARVERERVVLDLRTVRPEEDECLAGQLLALAT